MVSAVVVIVVNHSKPLVIVVTYLSLLILN
jgi:hypothetical protein